MRQDHSTSHLTDTSCCRSPKATYKYHITVYNYSAAHLWLHHNAATQRYNCGAEHSEHCQFKAPHPWALVSTSSSRQPSQLKSFQQEVWAFLTSHTQNMVKFTSELPLSTEAVNRRFSESQSSSIHNCKQKFLKFLQETEPKLSSL